MCVYNNEILLNKDIIDTMIYITITNVHKMCNTYIV